MANKRMFSLDVIDTDHFLEMSVSAQALYFHLGMRADDDGFVASPKKVAKISNCSDDDLRLLATKGYIIPFQSGVIVITHWKENNYIRKDRYTETKYIKEKGMLQLDGDRYVLKSGETVGIPNDNQVVDGRLTQVRLGKDSIDKINNICVHDVINEHQKVTSSESKSKNYSVHFESFWNIYPRKKEKAKAYKAYNARLKDGYSEEELLTAATAYAKECTDRRTEERYIKLAATFLGPSTPFTDYLGKKDDGSSQQSAKSTRFSNFNQRNYDFDELEKQLLEQ